MKTKKPSLLSRLFVFSEKHKYFTIIGMILSGLSALMALFPVVFIWLGVSEIFKMYPNITATPELVRNAYLAVGSALGAMIVYFIALMCTHTAAFRIARNMKYRAISHLTELPLGYLQSTGSGKLRRVISDSAAQTEAYLAHQLPDLVGAAVTPIAIITFLFIFDWRLGLVSIIPLVLGLFAMSFAMRDNSGKMRLYQDSLANMNNEAVEYVRGVSVIKTFGQSVFSFKKFHATIEVYKELVTSFAMNYRTPMIAYQTILGSAVSFLVIGGVLLFRGIQEPSVFMLDFLFYLFFTSISSVMFMRVMQLGQMTTLTEDAFGRVQSLLDEKPLTYKEKTTEPKNFDITLKDVAFSYPNTMAQAVSGVSLHIKEGTTAALVGASGSGKSTLATLIARFWDVSEGSVKIGGVDVRDMREEALMERISFVFQNTNLYKMSILDNVKEGKPNATEEEVLRALKAARCMEIINKLPNGIHTVVGTKGVFLSGGEAQRIAIARAILKDAPIILLDEATAFTDPENEHEIQLAMAELAKGKTVLMIAHRLSTVQNADCIYLMEEGRVIEQGTHEELIEKHGKYNAMWEEYQTAFIWKEGVA